MGKGVSPSLSPTIPKQITLGKRISYLFLLRLPLRSDGMTGNNTRLFAPCSLRRHLHNIKGRTVMTGKGSKDEETLKL
jgi:hypothetical protein